MSSYWRAFVLLSVVLIGLLGSSEGDEVATLTEKELESLITTTEFVLVLYCKYSRPLTVLRVHSNRITVPG